MDWMRTWLIGIVVAAMVAALADSLIPEGAAKKIGKLASGLLLMTAILQPLLGVDYEDMAGILFKYQMETEGYSAALETENERLIKTIIEEQTSAYIQDKAAQLDISCKAEVTCRKDEDGNLYPASVVVRGDLTQTEIKTLSRTIEGELAISSANQQYERINE